MDWGVFGSFISTVGFPIAACAALFYFMVKMLQEHKEEINALRSALEANTIAITELRGLLEHGQRVGDADKVRQSTGDPV